MTRNSHKYILKNIDPACHSESSKPSVNVSRSIGNSGNWIGCGSIDKTGVGDNLRDIQFPFYSLVYVVRGEGHYVDEKGFSHLLKSGSLFQRRPEIRHSTMVDPDCHWLEYYFDCNTEYFKHLCDVGMLEEDVAVYQLQPDPSILAEFDRLMRLLSLAHEQHLADVLLVFLNCIRNLVNQGNLTKEPGNSNNKVEKACLDFNRFIDKRVDMREYCKQNGYGYESFRKEFKRLIGISPGKYLVQKRLDQACRLLRSTNNSITEISAILGYKSQYEFSNQFKKKFGVFPTHFRDGSRAV